MYDPLELARQTAEIVSRGTARNYYRFRPDIGSPGETWGIEALRSSRTKSEGNN